MQVRVIPFDEWTDFFYQLSRQYQGSRMTVELESAGGDRQFTESPLLEIIPEAPHAATINLMAGTWMSETTHVIGAVTRVTYEETDSGVPAGVVIESATGERANVRFQIAPARQAKTPTRSVARATRRRPGATRAARTRKRATAPSRAQVVRRGRAKAGGKPTKRTITKKPAATKKRTGTTRTRAKPKGRKRR